MFNTFIFDTQWVTNIFEQRYIYLLNIFGDDIMTRNVMLVRSIILMLAKQWNPFYENKKYIKDKRTFREHTNKLLYETDQGSFIQRLQYTQ